MFMKGRLRLAQPTVTHEPIFIDFGTTSKCYVWRITSMYDIHCANTIQVNTNSIICRAICLIGSHSLLLQTQCRGSLLCLLFRGIYMHG